MKTAKQLAQGLRSTTLDEAKASYAKLLNAGCEPKPRDGMAAIDYYFFDKRLDTKSKYGDSFVEFFHNKGHLASESTKRLYWFKRREMKLNHLQAIWGVYSVYRGSIAAFRPAVAVGLYCKFKPKRILDPCAGWGGRAMAAMTLGIPYVGFDTNIDLKPAYEAMARDLPHKAPIQIYFKDSSKADYSKVGAYDMVFTSPPYFKDTWERRTLEDYPHMPSYPTKAVFNETFLWPMVVRAYEHLSPKGVFALNVHQDMYPDLVGVLGPCKQKLPLSRGDRSVGFQASEFVYVWRKT